MEKKDILDDRTFLEIHMMQSIDGKATGDFFKKPDCWAGVKDYHNLFSELKAQAFCIGRVTMEELNKDKPDLTKYKGRKKSNTKISLYLFKRKLIIISLLMIQREQ